MNTNKEDSRRDAETQRPIETILVAGIGRCGTSLTMQMLEAGGADCIGRYPAFEEFPIGETPWKECSGKAVKLVDPLLHLPPDGHYRVILLDRNATEQARSQVKFMSFVLGRRLPTPASLPKSIRRDFKKTHAWALKQHACLVLTFEQLLHDPLHVAETIQRFLGKDLNLRSMAACARKRSPKCYPGMLEAELLP